ncbi:MAG: hypothetical protein WEB37_12005 [Bacteroidota bacterium]
MIRRNVFKAILFNAVLAFALQAQFTVSTDFTAMYDDNINNSSYRVEDRIGQLSMIAGYEWGKENTATQIAYTGSLSYFTRVLDRTFHYHTLGLTQSRLLGQDAATDLSLGAAYSFRINREYYTFYDHSQFSLFGNLKFNITDEVTGKTGYTFRALAFSQLPDFNYTEHSGFAQISFSLPTKTSVIFEGNLGFKVYESANFDSANSGGVMMGAGRNRVAASTPTVTQLIGILRIGQSITEMTGLSLTATYLGNIQKESRYLSSSYGTISDDEIFDDHYAYEGPHGSIMLSHLVNENLILRIAGGIQAKLYSDRPAFDLAGTQIADQRKDTRRYLTLLAQLYVETLDVTVSGQYDYISNSSNDEYYRYANNAMTVTFSLPF